MRIWYYVTYSRATESRGNPLIKACEQVRLGSPNLPFLGLDEFHLVIDSSIMILAEAAL